MIRLFIVFCKLKFKKISAEQLFYEAAKDIDISDFPCPKCGTRHPNWSYFDDYDRNLISFEEEKYVNHSVHVQRFQCSSCDGTHAIIPEIAIPYSSHSILFVLDVLRDRFINKMTVRAICAKYIISERTFYRWKNLFEKNRRLWLGILKKLTASFSDFFDNHPSGETSNFLYTFWQRFGLSFFQPSLHGEKVHPDIRLHPPPAFSPGFHIKRLQIPGNGCVILFSSQKKEAKQDE